MAKGKVLTPIGIANLRARPSPYEISDPGCAGLRVAVFPSGKRSYIVRYRFKGLSRKLTLGPALIGGSEPAGVAPEIGTPLSLAAARELATKALREAKGGIDPTAVKRQQHEAEHAVEANTFQAIAEEFLRREGGALRTLDQRSADLKLLYAQLGALPIEQVKRGQLVRTLDTIADTRGPVRSDRVLTAAKRLLSWHAGRSEYVSVLTAVKRRVSIAERARDRVLTDDELRMVWQMVETFPGPFGPYVQFVTLTATRRNEAGGMRRSELVNSATWVLPRARWKVGKKAKNDLLIPLSKAAQAIIAARPAGDAYIFGGKRPLGNYARRKDAFDSACGVTGWTIHDLRRTARTLLSRITTPDIAERCLGHAMPGQRGTYDQHGYESEMRAAFEALAHEIERIAHPPPASVADLAVERRKRKHKA